MHGEQNSPQKADATHPAAMLFGGRRDFLKTTSVLSLSLLSGASVWGAGQEKRDDMLYRTLGSTGEKVSVIGVGGHHIGRPQAADEGIRLVRKALDHGINFLDNCWDYHKGESEVRMGMALRDGYREKAFLMTKIDGRTGTAAENQLNESLKRLQTDHIDLIQFHEVIRIEDPDRIFGETGAFEAIQKAKKAGKVRFIGFTGHKDPILHLRMLDVAAQHGIKFDAVQMPLNVMDAHFRSFGQQVVPRLVQEKTGILGMKSMGDGIILQSKTVSPMECLHFAMNLPTSTVITGIENQKILDQALEAVRTFHPLSEEQLKSLLARTSSAAATGKFELFKTSQRFDETARNLEWLG
ncbi:MAG: Twin-arginine translocation pathway signal [Verrucomicrobiales bacterium]|nr:Twin-arginine translocation pathway signal [Verrucomicrobiales bacterium]